MPSSTASSSLENFGPKDHEVSFKTRMGSTVVQNTEKDLAEGDTIANPQVRHSDANSMARTGAPVAWNSNQITNSQASAGQPEIWNSVTDIDLEAKEKCNILSVTTVSTRER